MREVNIFGVLSTVLIFGLFGGLYSIYRFGPVPSVILLGLAFSLIAAIIVVSFEVFIFQQGFLRLSNLVRLSIRSAAYITIFTALFLIIEVYGDPVRTMWMEYILFGLVLILFNTIMMLRSIMGKTVLWDYITGKYYHPKKEDRVFMFLDMKDSTTLAEKIGPLKFHLLLKEFYYDLSDIIMSYHGEIYSYVGDEIIITWKSTEGLRDANCIHCYYDMLERIHKHISNFYKEFGVFVEFRVGMHIGSVVTGEIGDFKKQIFFLGDTVNTTSRIQEQCKNLEKSILISGDLIKKIELPEGIDKESIGWIKLRGKEHRVELFTLKR